MFHNHSGPRNLEGLNTAKQGIHDSRLIDNVPGDYAIDALTYSVEGYSVDRNSLRFETLPSGRQNTLGTSFGDQKYSLATPGSHPYGMRSTASPSNQEISRLEFKRFIQKEYGPPDHQEFGRTAPGYRIQGLGSGYPGLTQTTIFTANPPVVNILSLQHPQPAIPSLGTVPTAYTTLGTICNVGDGSILGQVGAKVTLPSSRTFHSERHHIAPTRQLPYPLQPFHHSIAGDVQGTIAPSSSKPLTRNEVPRLKIWIP